MSLRQQLESVDETLQKLIIATRNNHAEYQRAYLSELSVEEAVDANGRPVLADLVVARANVLCAIANIEHKEAVDGV